MTHLFEFLEIPGMVFIRIMSWKIRACDIGDTLSADVDEASGMIVSGHEESTNFEKIPTTSTLIMPFTYVIEHMEDDEHTPAAVPPWVTLEYAVRRS